ncbi:hypothetical protein GCM10007382_10130 [Salinibacterium xinjiangense]|uniref:Uncharacterized protein n=1 Tax=Salinibacterium xinjiangense TaxID=386302 RepID=A0A2C8Z7R4_9MICO|nr:hypothetical protein [Salinibacterium xinjiangense]GGK91936.1 hypothetical protein GCM10007382_10130 [Salinibacterium xinjiangense]SOE59944.1 hypothetical protein SAMN06296378_1016 [Salinibacterium xinjiangense]
MSRFVGTRVVVSTIVLDVLLTVILSLVLLTVWRGVASGSIGGSLGQAGQRLFLFMDIGLLVWVILLGVAAGRGRSAGAGLTLVFAAVGTLANLMTVVVVGFVQQGAWAEQFILFAIEAGIAVLFAATVAVLLVHRLILKPSSAPRNPS